MNKRKSPYEIEKVTLNLRKGDFARLRELHPQIGAGPAIAKLVIGYLRKVEDAMKDRGLGEAEMLDAAQE